MQRYFRQTKSQLGTVLLFPFSKFRSGAIPLLAFWANSSLTAALPHGQASGRRLFLMKFSFLSNSQQKFLMNSVKIEWEPSRQNALVWKVGSGKKEPCSTGISSVQAFKGGLIKFSGR